MTEMSRPVEILRLDAVKRRTGQPSSTIYRDMADGRFPRPVPIGARSVGWLSTEIDEWIAARIAQRDTKLTNEAGCESQ
jgi:prophage regulatory protein